MRTLCTLSLALTISSFVMGRIRADQTYPADASIADATWASGETITIQGALTITGLVSVEPGVVVRSASGALVTITSTGSLVAAGSAELPITFTGSTSEPDVPYWGGVRVNGGAIALTYTTLRHARVGIHSVDGSVILHHSAVQDIVGADGATGASNSPGMPGTSATGILVSGNSTLEVSDTRILGVTGGKGGRGGGASFPNINGKPGGTGGGAIGIDIEADSEASISLERIEIGTIGGGKGGMGGNSVSVVPGGAGGNSGDAWGIRLAEVPGVLLRNCTFHHVRGLDPGTGGSGSSTGATGRAGHAYGASLTTGTLTVQHCVFDSIGSVSALPGAGLAANGPSASVELVNCSFSEMPSSAIAADGLAQATADHCNFFNAGAAGSTVALVSPLAVDPKFSNAVGGDYHLLAGSALVNGGIVTGTTDDIDGELRDDSPDIGVDELYLHGRAAGDFDNTGCTDLLDFFFVIDNWQADPGDGTVVGIEDFLALIDNWRTGPSCP